MPAFKEVTTPLWLKICTGTGTPESITWEEEHR